MEEGIRREASSQITWGYVGRGKESEFYSICNEGILCTDRSNC